MTKLTDLIYAGESQEEIKMDILAKYPGATFEDASDDIHQGRFQVEIEGIDRLEWYNWVAFEGGFSDLSLHFGLSLRMGHLQLAEGKEKELAWTDKYKKEIKE